MLVVHAIECPVCGSVVFSRTRHDCRFCMCGNCYIDGGSEYTRVGFSQAPASLDLMLKVDRDTLVWDWRAGADKYGLLLKGVVYEYVDRFEAKSPACGVVRDSGDQVVSDSRHNPRQECTGSGSSIRESECTGACSPCRLT